jgi:Fe-S cluster assembly scaffold protein SufB
MMGKGRTKKEPFADLPDEWKDAIQQGKPEEIEKEIARLGIGEEENKKLKTEDEDLARCREEVKVAGEQYRAATKGYRLRMKFIMQVLESRGKV